jgi:hypothetical protein
LSHDYRPDEAVACARSLADKAFETLQQPRCKAAKPDDNHGSVSSEAGTEEIGPQKAEAAGVLPGTQLTGCDVLSWKVLAMSQELLIYASSNGVAGISFATHIIRVVDLECSLANAR